MIGIVLAISAIALLAVIAVQDFLVPALRNKTISSGLTGPDHVLLDAAYVPLAASMFLAFLGQGWLEASLAAIAAVSLVLVAVTNTAWKWVDSLSKGQHATWHSRFTVAVFISALAVQAVANHGWYWLLTALNVLVPGACYAYFHYRKTTVDGVVIQASPAAEKLYVAGLCTWLAMWGLVR